MYWTFFISDGPFLQKLSQFETSPAPTTGTFTRNSYKLVGGDGLSEADRKKIINKLSEVLSVRFQDMEQGLISATSIANFKVWPLEEQDLEG